MGSIVKSHIIIKNAEMNGITNICFPWSFLPYWPVNTCARANDRYPTAKGEYYYKWNCHNSQGGGIMVKPKRETSGYAQVFKGETHSPCNQEKN
jgi:hypothetical protein